MNIQQLLKQEYFENTVEQWLIALGVAIVLTIALFLLNSLLIKNLKKLAETTETDLDNLFADLLAKTNLFLLLLISLYVGSLYLNLNEPIANVRRSIIVITVLFQVGFWASGIISHYIDKKASREVFGRGSKVTQLKAFGFVVKVFIWITIFLLIISNLGFNVTTLITGLGIGGIAIALALQNVLGDVIASLSIILDKPFEVGDFIVVDDLRGDVEDIGLKTTRVRSISGEQLVFSNNDLLQSRIKNYKRMNDRRILFTLGVVYETPYEKLEKIPDLLREIITDEPRTRFDRTHFYSYGDFSLNYEIVYYVLSPDYIDYMNAQQNINLAVFKRFGEEGIEFAYPTQTLFVNKNAPDESREN